MNRRPPIHQRLESAITRYLPGWAASRADARMRAAQQNYLAAGYDAAMQKAQRAPRAIWATSEDGNLSQADLDSIREWSRQTYRNNAIMSGLLRRAADNIVGGTGLKIEPKTGDGGLNAELKAAFDDYGRAGGGWEVTGRFSLKEGQRLTFFSVARDGDLVLYRSDDGWQFFEGGQIGTPRGYDRNAAKIVNGVQTDAAGRPLRYWVADYSKLGYIDAGKARGLRADLCRYVGNKEWFSGTRCLPVYWNCLGRFEDLDRYLEAELLGAMASACVMGELQSPQGPGALDALRVRRDGDSTESRIPNGPRKIEFAPASVVQTYPGEKFTLHHAARPVSTFPDYVKLNLRLFGVPIGLPLEISLMDYTETNFAAARMAVAQAALSFYYWQEIILADQMLVPVYQDWLAVQTAVRIPAGTDKLRAYEIISPTTEWIDAYKEALAINAGLEGGWETLTHVLKDQLGRTVQDVFNERADEILLAKKIAKAKGLDPNEVLRYLAEWKKQEPEAGGQKTEDE